MKKRIAIVGYFPVESRGPVTQAFELSRLLGTNGYSVVTVSKYGNKWIRLLDIVFQLIFKWYRYDIAIVQFYSGNSLIWQYIAAKIVKYFGKKLVFTVHGGGVPDRIKKLPRSYLPLLKAADVVTVPSVFMKTALGQHAINSILIENTLPLNEYPFYHKETLRPVLLWMRAFSDIYNPLMAVRVVAELKKKFSSVKMYMGGKDLGLLNETKKLIEELDLANNIEIVGFMNLTDKKKYGNLCDFYITTNKIDNAPVTVLEMWAMGLVVISTKVGGMADLIDNGINGCLVNDNNHIGMAEKIEGIIVNNSLAHKLVANGKEKVKSYNEKVVYDKWEKVLDQL